MIILVSIQENIAITEKTCKKLRCLDYFHKKWMQRISEKNYKDVLQWLKWEREKIEIPKLLMKLEKLIKTKVL